MSRQNFLPKNKNNKKKEGEKGRTKGALLITPSIWNIPKVTTLNLLARTITQA